MLLPTIDPSVFIHDVSMKLPELNELTTISYHCKGQNTTSIGIALVGNFSKSVPSFVQLRALAQLHCTLDSYLGVLPIKPHSYYRATECPGTHFSMTDYKYLHYLKCQNYYQ